MDQTAPTVRRQLEASFLSNLPVIDSAIRIVARRNHLSEDERDEFAGEVRLAFVERDYDILARFQGASSLRTYLVTVIARQFSDYRRRLWGKWRLSAEAKRRGVVAERLEVLLYRDHVTLGEAIEILQTNLGVTQSREELVALAQALPPRVDRRPVSGDALTGVAAGELASPEVQVEGDQTASRTQTLVAEVLEKLTAQDRLILRMRFEDNISLADIARLLKLDDKKLYRRMEALLASLRKELETRGLAWTTIQPMIERGQCHLRLPALPAETAARRPSPQEGQL